MYRWTNKSLESVVPADDFGNWLKSLPDQNPGTIVKAASNPRSTGHALFNWDDESAAYEQRLTRARVLLGSFVIETEIITNKNEPKIIDVPFIIRSGPGKYEQTMKAMKDDEKRDFILQEALAEFRRVRAKYSHLSELALVFAALDKVETRKKAK